MAVEVIPATPPRPRKRRWEQVLRNKRLQKELFLEYRREQRAWETAEKLYWLRYSDPKVLVPETDSEDLVDMAIRAMEVDGNLPAAFRIATTEYRSGRADTARELAEHSRAIYLRSDTEPLSFGETPEASDVFIR